jgi:hypothetical protein
LKFKFAKPPKKENQKLGRSNKLQHLATLQANAHYVQVVQFFKHKLQNPKNISLELELASTKIASFYTAAAAADP